MNYCPNCGRAISGSERFCPNCGACLNAGSQRPYNSNGNRFRENTGVYDSDIFIDACKQFFLRCLDFSGRTSKTYFWWAMLLCLISVCFGIFLFFFIPFLAILFRRLHDLGKSGIYSLFLLVPVAGWILLGYWCLKDGEVGPNQYGEDPLRSI